MKPSTQRLLTDASSASALANMLEHLAWTDTLEPQLLAHREALVQQLTESVLGRTPFVQTNAQGIAVPLKPEHLAGRIAGIDFMLKLMRKILTDGDKADSALRETLTHA